MAVSIVAATVGVLFVSVITKAILGFGDALLAIPLLTLIVGVRTATPLVSLMAFLSTVAIIVHSWRAIDMRSTRRLIGAAALGVPVGVWGITFLPGDRVTDVLGVLMILIGVYFLWRPRLAALSGSGWAYGFGFVAGVFSGAYSMASPPMIVYGATQRWSPEQFRVTLQSFFLPVNVMVLITHASAGLWTGHVFTLLIVALPVLPVGLWAGRRVSVYIPAAVFERIVYAALIVLGVLLVA